MASGCPVLTSNISSLPEICQDAAVYCDPQDITNISDKLDNILNNNNRDLIKKGRLQAKKFSWDKCAKETINIYNKIC